MNESDEYFLELSADKITELFLRSYISEYGELKARQVVEKVTTSVRVNTYLQTIAEMKIIPSSRGITGTVIADKYFAFSKAETLCLGSLSLFSRWNDFYNDNDDAFLSEEEASSLAREIIEDCHRLKFGKNNFFTRFYSQWMSNLIQSMREEREARNNDLEPI